MDIDRIEIKSHAVDALRQRDIDSSSTTPHALSHTISSRSAATSSSSTSTGIVNYYFAIIALAVCVALAVGWLIFRHKRLKAVRQRTHRQSALARDLDWPLDNERWAGRNRWMYGSGLLGLASNSLRGPRHTNNEGAEEDGLNEQGEAPPPYKGREQRDAMTDGQGNEEGQHEDVPSHQTPRMPPRSVSREGAGLKPPDYEEIHIGSSSADRPISTTHTDG